MPIAWPKKLAGLFEFFEENRIGVGEVNWIILNETLELQKVENTIGYLKEIILKKIIVKVKWPVSNKNKATNYYPAKLLQIGKWDEMRQACDNLEKYETMTPIKENRKYVSKRKANYTSSEESDNEASEVVQLVDSKKENIQKKLKSKKHFQTSVKQTLVANRKKEEIANLTFTSDESIQTNSIEKLDLLSSTNNQLENPLGQKIDSLQIAIIKLTSEISILNKTLKDRNNKIESVDTVSNEKPFSLDPHTNNYYIEYPVDENLNPTNINVSSDRNGNDSNMEMAIVTDQEKEIKDVPKERNHRKEKNNDFKQLLNLKETNINVQDDVTVSPIKTKIDENIQVKYKTVSKSSFLQLDDSKLNKSIVLIGGIEVPQEKLALCSRKASLTKFVKDVMLLIFTEQEMANSSLTGTTPNLHANHKDDVLQKQKLDPIRVKALHDYVAKEMPSRYDVKLVQEAIKQKLHYISKRVNGVAFKKEAKLSA